MPKYKNNKEKAEYLENIVLLLERIISNPDAVVKKNVLIKDITGLEREFDIWIEQNVNKRRIITAIECKNYKSSISIEKIEAFYSKCKSTPQINKMIYVATSGYQRGAIHKAKDYGIEPYLIKDINTNSINISLLHYRFEINQVFVTFKHSPNHLYSIKNEYYTKLYNRKGVQLTKKGLEESIKKNEETYKFLIVDDRLLINYRKKIYPQYNVTGLFYRIENNKEEQINKIFLDADIEIKIVDSEKDTTKSYTNIINDESLAQITEYTFDIEAKQMNVHIIKNDEQYIFHPENSEEYHILSTKDEITIEETKSRSIEIKNVESKNIEYRYEFNENTLPISKDQSLDIFEPREQNKLNVFVILSPSDNSISVQIPIKLNNNRMFTGKFPDPLWLYMNSTINFRNMSEKIKEHVTTSFSHDKKPLMYSDGDYFQYIQYHTSSLFMLKSAVEFYINGLIPDEFKSNKKETKREIINNIDLEGKIYQIIPQINSIDLTPYHDIIKNIVSLCNLSSKLQNIEQSSQLIELQQPYFELFAQSLALDLSKCIDDITTLYEILYKRKMI